MPETITTLPYGKRVVTSLGFADAVTAAKELLKDEGFGVLCEIDVAATLRQKIHVEIPPYVILGACNPQLAHRALSVEPELGLLLPCNVTVSAQAAGTSVAAIDAGAMMRVVGNPALEPIAVEVNARLERVLERLAAR